MMSNSSTQSKSHLQCYSTGVLETIRIDWMRLIGGAPDPQGPGIVNAFINSWNIRAMCR